VQKVSLRSSTTGLMDNFPLLIT